MKRIIAALTLSLAAVASWAACVNSPSDSGGSLPLTTGKLVWHSYTSYGDGSSQLFVRDIAAGSTTNVSSSWACASGCTVKDPMNAVWSADGNWLLFMGVANNAWNLFAVSASGGSPINLTGSTGTTRNEDPKFSADGTKVVWKQGQAGTWRVMQAPWSVTGGTPSLGTTTTLITGSTENSMPFLDSAGTTLYYSAGSSSPFTLYSKALPSGTPSSISSSGYYPVVRWSDNTVFWADDTTQGANDQVAYKASGGSTTYPSINDCNGNNSDPWPVGSTNYVFFSSTTPGGYQLYLGDLSNGNRYNLSAWYSDTAKAHLGSSYYSGTGGGGGGSGSSTTVNLARVTGQTTNPSATASSTTSPMVASRAIDGNTADTNASRWDSTEPMPNPSYLIVDLGSQCAVGYTGVCTITGIDLYKDSYPTHNEIDISSDGTNWTSIWSITNDTSYTHRAINQTALGGAKYGRYIRAYGTATAPYGMSLPEIQIWGCTAQTCN